MLKNINCVKIFVNVYEVIMKKRINICLLLIACVALVLTGCGGNVYLVTAATTVSPATFYASYYTNSVLQFDGVPNNSTIIPSTSDQITYYNHVKSIYEVLPEERCLVSVLDYLCAVNQVEGEKRLDDKTTTKLYEYSNLLQNELVLGATNTGFDNYATTKAVVLVKGANNNAELTAYLFYKNKDAVCELADLMNEVSNANYSYTFRQTKYNIQTKTYSLSYGTNTANATFNENKGTLQYDITTYLNGSSSAVKFEKSIYKYANGAVGLRVLTTTKQGSANNVVVYEQLSKDFYHRLKVGLVKDLANVLSLETMQEAKLAKSNTSDSVGFELEYDIQNDLENNKITCIKYGGVVA